MRMRIREVEDRLLGPFEDNIKEIGFYILQIIIKFIYAIMQFTNTLNHELQKLYYPTKRDYIQL